MNNPPAFPVVETIINEAELDGKRQHHGMTLRDYFAGQALINWSKITTEQPITPEKIPSFVAQMTYTIADAMLKAREQ
jgi:hypothetical protein